MTPEMVNSDLIALARKFRGMTQTALSRRTSVTQGYLSKVEQGLTQPNSEVIGRVAEATEFPTAFFMSGHRVYGLPVSVHPMFRKKASVPAKTLNAIHAEVNIRIMHLRRLLESADLSFDFELPRLDADEYGGDAEEIARLVRGHWLVPPGPVACITEFIERAGCVVIPSDFAHSDIDGVSLDVPGLLPTIFVNRNRPADRQRFTLAHELGHLVMHRVPTPDMEREANAFASAFLMPKDEISPHLRNITIRTLAQLKPIWRVSMAALLARAKGLGRLSQSQSQQLWRQMATYRRREPPELDFPAEHPRIIMELIALHMDELGYSDHDLSSLLQMNYAEISSMYNLRRPNLSVVK